MHSISMSSIASLCISHGSVWAPLIAAIIQQSCIFSCCPTLLAIPFSKFCYPKLRWNTCRLSIGLGCGSGLRLWLFHVVVWVQCLCWAEPVVVLVQSLYWAEPVIALVQSLCWAEFSLCPSLSLSYVVCGSFLCILSI